MLLRARMTADEAQRFEIRGHSAIQKEEGLRARFACQSAGKPHHRRMKSKRLLWALVLLAVTFGLWFLGKPKEAELAKEAHALTNEILAYGPRPPGSEALDKVRAHLSKELEAADTFLVPNISVGAHLGGLGAGVLLSLIIAPKTPFFKGKFQGFKSPYEPSEPLENPYQNLEDVVIIEDDGEDSEDPWGRYS